MLDLLLSEHYGECYSCVRNGNCELQTLAEEYGVDQFPLRPPGRVRSSRSTPPATRSCATWTSASAAGAACAPASTCRRSACSRRSTAATETEIATFEDLPLGDVVCINCGQCINRCPTGALYAKDETDAVWTALDDPDQARRHPDGAGAAGPRWARCFGLEPGTPVTFEMNTALRRVGFDHVFDTNFSADLTIIEEGTELILRLYDALVQGRQRGRPAAVHELLAGLGQVPRALLSRVPAERLVGQEPAADVRRAHQDLLRREARPRPGRTSSAARSCRARPRSSSATGPRCTTRGFKDVDFGHHHARARQDVQGAGHRRAQPAQVATSTTRSAPPPAPA